MGLLTNTKTATIASGAALSPAIMLGRQVLCAITMPATWTAADLTFQVSDDNGTTWSELRDSAGAAITVASPTAAYRLEVDASDFKSAVFLKVRSGTAGVPVNQGAARTFTLATRNFYPR